MLIQGLRPSGWHFFVPLVWIISHIPSSKSQYWHNTYLVFCNFNTTFGSINNSYLFVAKLFKQGESSDCVFRDGKQCDWCIPLGGCVHGGCKEPFECDCNLSPHEETRGKYSGPHCDKRNFKDYYWHLLTLFTYPTLI